MNTQVKFNKSNGLFVLEPSVSKLVRVFQSMPFVSGELIKRDSKNNTGENTATTTTIVTQVATTLVSEFIIAYIHQRARATTTSDFSVILEEDSKEKHVFIPAKEVLTMGWLLPVYDLRQIPIDEAYPDLLRLLLVLPLKNVGAVVEVILRKVFKLISGKVEE